MTASQTIRESNESRVTEVDGAVRLLTDYDTELRPSIDPITIIALFRRAVETFPDRDALMFKDESQEWRSLTFRAYKERVERVAKVFLKLGLVRHGTVAVFAFNCAEWLIAELAAIHAGGVITGIYSTSSSEACFHILESSRANVCVVDGKAEMEKIRQIRDKLPHLRAVIQINGPFGRPTEGFWRWEDAMLIETEEFEGEYRERIESIAVNECCCIIYTSGTVGKPKGVMLSNDNLTFNTENIVRGLGNIETGREVFVSYLPLAHLAAQMSDVFIPLAVGATVYFADKDALKSSLLQTLLEARPTFFLGVPRVFEKIHEKMIAVGSQAGLVRRTIGSWARKVVLQHHMDSISGSPSNSLEYRIASTLIISKVKQALGFERCKTFLTGAAPFNEATRSFFLSLDMPIIDGYGMTESSSVHSLTTLQCPIGSKSLTGTRTKILNPDADGHGEICMRGRHVFMGYVNERDKTCEAIDGDLWLHSGDRGVIDKDGNIHVTGRFKELIVTSGGKKVPFEAIENRVRSECPAIANALLVGDRKRFLSILLTFKTESNEDGSARDDLTDETIKWLSSKNLKFARLSEVRSDMRVLRALQAVIDRVNEQAASSDLKIQKFAILPSDFSITTGEFTPTMKVKRNFVLEKYEGLIDGFYE